VLYIKYKNMANQSKLKAWVRYDGTGRVISGGPIFQVNKPKVGNWKQINANLCCNGGSTTTTTTQGSGGVTPTAFILPYWVGVNQACSEPAQSPAVFYSASAYLSEGSTLFTNAALTIPVQTGFVIANGLTKLQVFSGGYLQVFNCAATTTSTTTQGPSAYTVGVGPLGSSPEVCSNPSPWSSTQTLWALGSGYDTGRQLYYDSAFTTPFTGTGWYAVMQGFPSGTKYSVYFNNGVLTAGFPC
jgi:hypothetical protein